MGKLGLFGLPFATEYGGMGGDYVALCVAIEELARVDSSVAITLEAAVSLGAMPIARFGTEEQKQEWLPRLLAGEALAAFGLTEPGFGSDAGGARTRAVLDEATGEWVINGSKAFITNSGTDITAVIAVACVTDVVDGRNEMSTILVPSGTPGLTVAPGYSKVGWCASDTHELVLSDVRVPYANLLGQRGRGFAQFLQTLDEGRIAIAALAVGLAQACLDHSLRYATERHTFGLPIGARQAVAFSLSDLAVAVEASRLLVYKAAWLKDAGRPSDQVKQAASIAKLHATEAAVTATRVATQVFGGNGFMEEFPVARFYRDAKILEIGEGTSEVQRMVIAKGLGLPTA